MFLNKKVDLCISYRRSFINQVGHNKSELWIISPTVREAFGAPLLAVVAGLVCRTPTSSNFHVRIELVLCEYGTHLCSLIFEVLLSWFMVYVKYVK